MTPAQRSIIAAAEPLTFQRLHEVLRYNPATGIWHWRVTLSNRARRGEEAGGKVGRGDIHIRIDGKYYKAHRLAWFYVSGRWPPDQIDHEDLDRSHNWWDNIRLADNSQNNANRRVRPDSKTGVKNVSYYPQKSKANPYVAFGQRNQKKVWVGAFPTLEMAARAAFEHAQREYGEFARAS